MAVKENEVYRAALDIGDSIIEIIKTRVAQSQRDLELSNENMSKLLRIIDQNGVQAKNGSMKTFVIRFDEFKKDLSSPK